MSVISKREIIQSLYDLEYSDLVEVKGFLDQRVKSVEQSMPRPVRKSGFMGLG